jgi:uncharacterized protein YndB with AHSA1/START domain
MKFTGNPQMLEGVSHLGWQAEMLTKLGMLEATCIVLYLLPPFSVLGAILLTGYLGGAISTHMRIGEPVLMHVGIGLLIWGGLFLREPRIRSLLPVRGKDFNFEREITINRPSDAVFAYLKPLRNFESWNPFLKKDCHVKTEYRGTDGEVGFTSSWDGEREVGSGEQEITKVVNGRKIEFELRFKRPFKATNTGYFATESVGGTQTRVRWGIAGNTSFPMTVIGLFMSSEKMIGKEFEAGLNQLKSILEK